MKPKKKLELVRSGPLLYPHKDADYQILSELGVPLNNLSAEFAPALLTFLPSHVKTTILKFEDVEAAMLERFEAKWEHDVTINAKAVTLTYPKNVKPAHLEKAVSSLKKWYRGHFYTLEASEKRAGREMRTILTKTLTPRREL